MGAVTATRPVRVQRRRVKGWRMPQGALYVGRPSGWGNPYTVKRVGSGEYVVMSPTIEIPESWGGHAFAARYAVGLYRAAFTNGVWSTTLARTELAGRDLACWCPLDLPCHVDVLLDIANGSTP